MPRTRSAGAAAVSSITQTTHALLRTKILIPDVRSGMIERRELFALLDAGQTVTLVTAPAGAGKTTLLAQYAAQYAARNDHAVAWVALDELDNDLGRFLAYLVAALQQSEGAVYDRYAAEATVTEALNTLVNTPLTLVLDNYHLISNAAVHDALKFMIEHLPAGARLIISGRTYPPLPLARLRAAGQLTQLDNLALTSEECACLLGAVADDTGARLLYERTCGWIAGVRLAALWAAERHEDEQFDGSYRHVYDYFMEEVVEPQPAALQNFLLHTAILDPLCAEACDAVTGRDDGQAVLERLEQLNLFVSALDSKRRAYRYHPLFAEFLREWLRKQQGNVNDLHLRASLWYERNAEMEQALEHALAAGEWERVGALIHACNERGLDTQGWVERLPEDLRQRPTLIEPLSERETEVLEMLSSGLSNPEIANRLIIAVSTVKTHVKNIYRKLDVDTRYEAMQRAREMDLLTLRMERDYRRLIQ